MLKDWRHKSMETNENIIENNVDVNEPKTFTEDEVKALIQKESDRRVSQAMKTVEAKWNKKMETAEKLRDMNEEQKRNFQLEEKIKELEELNAKYVLAENKNTLANALSERGLPTQFVDYLISDSAETMMDNLNAFEIVWKKALSDAVKNKIPSSEPKSSSSVGGLTKEDFKHMSLAERQELYDNNPRLYEALKN